MALILRCGLQKEMIIKIGNDVEVTLRIERGQIKASVEAPKKMQIDKEVVHVAGFTESSSKFYRGDKDDTGNV